MTDLTEMVEWLRSEIEGDRDAAVKAGAKSWTAKRLDRDDLFDAPFTAIYTNDYPWREVARSGVVMEGDHIVRHDPRDTIARCEAELKLIDGMAKVIGGEYIDDGELPLAQWVLGELISGYRHRPGWKEGWAP